MVKTIRKRKAVFKTVIRRKLVREYRTHLTQFFTTIVVESGLLNDYDYDDLMDFVEEAHHVLGFSKTNKDSTPDIIYIATELLKAVNAVFGEGLRW